MTHRNVTVHSYLTVKEMTYFCGTLRFILSLVEACFFILLFTRWIQWLFLQDLLQYWLCSYRRRLVFCFFPLDFSKTNARSVHCASLTAVAFRPPSLTILTEEHELLKHRLCNSLTTFKPWHRVVPYVVRRVSEKSVSSIFYPDDGGNTFFFQSVALSAKLHFVITHKATVLIFTAFKTAYHHCFLRFATYWRHLYGWTVHFEINWLFITNKCTWC
jgi:hypothetical protein